MKDFLKRALLSGKGDSALAVRLSKVAARRVNDALGDPLGMQPRSSAPSVPVIERKPEPAPVMVYFEKDRNQRQLERIAETLDARSIPFRKLDVAGDEATMHFIMREAGCERDELPVVFIAGDVIGGLNALIAADVSGDLVKRVFG